MSGEPLLEVEDLAVDYGTGRRRVRAVSGVTFRLEAGKTLGLVGESGSGKTTIGRAILGLVPVSAGRIRFQGQDITNDSPRQRRQYAARIRAVFQDPYSTLNPAKPIRASLLEGVSPPDASRPETLSRLLEHVALPADVADRFPVHLSGGQRQRVSIARALNSHPSLVICDEAVSALDVSVQAKILNLLRDAQDETGLGYLFISHDLDVVRYMSDDILVLFRGEVVESGTAEAITTAAQHPYTRALLAATPRLDERANTVPSPHPARVDASPRQAG